MSHDCVKRINEHLKPLNSELAWSMSWSNPSRELIEITTVKLDPAVRGKPMHLYATYCPFCGIKLEGKE